MATLQTGLKVLLVEDEAIVAMLLEDMLADLGHQVVATAGRLDQALEFAGRLSVDLALLDINLNGQRTYAAADILKARGVPMIFATGYGAAGVDVRLGDAPVLQKPFELHELKAAIARAVTPR